MADPSPQAKIVTRFTVKRKWESWPNPNRPYKEYTPWEAWTFGLSSVYAVVLQDKKQVYVIYCRTSPPMCKIYPDLETAKITVELQT